MVTLGAASNLPGVTSYDGPASQATTDVQRAVEDHPGWHQTIDIAPGVTTPGLVDLRPIVDQLPWPNVRGKRCLDIGTSDGYLAFELERRGAAEVVAIAGLMPAHDAGFRLAAELTGSAAEWQPLSIDDLDRDDVGMFDVVVCGSVLVHLRDPIRALEAVSRVTRGVFLSAEPIELWMSVLARGKPLFTLNGGEGDRPWLSFNGAGHKQLLTAAGFAIERTSKPYTVRFNQHPEPPPTLRNRVHAAGARAVTGTREPGVLHRALLARPHL